MRSWQVLPELHQCQDLFHWLQADIYLGWFPAAPEIHLLLWSYLLSENKYKSKVKVLKSKIVLTCFYVHHSQNLLKFAMNEVRRKSYYNNLFLRFQILQLFADIKKYKIFLGFQGGLNVYQALLIIIYIYYMLPWKQKNEFFIYWIVVFSHHITRLILHKHLSVSGAGHSYTHRTWGPMTGEAYNSHIMAEIFAPKLGPNSHLLGQFVDFIF